MLKFTTHFVTLCISGLLLLSGAATAQESLSFKKIKLNKKTAQKELTLKSCALFNSVSLVKIIAGNLVILPQLKKKGVYTLPTKYNYFACAVDSNNQVSLFAKKKLTSEVLQFTLTESDFPDLSNNAAKFNLVCPSVKPWPSQYIYKTIGSNHFSSGDLRRSTIGFIMAFGAPGSAGSCLSFYNSAGAETLRVGRYYPNNAYEARLYSATGCGTPLTGAQHRAKARKGTNDDDVYVKVSGVCYGPIDSDSCKNSSQC